MFGFKLKTKSISSLSIGIIGGGPAGIAAAIKLNQYGFKVVLFNASKPNQVVVGEHLAAEALHEFKKLNIPVTILNDHSIPCSEVQNAWGDSEIHHNESIFNPFGESYILSRPDFDNALLKYCEKLGVKVYLENRVSKIIKNETNWTLFFNKEKIEADFVIDASGRTSKFNFDIVEPKKNKKDTLIGITKHLIDKQVEPVCKSHLLVESTSNGWWYTVQVATGETVSTFMTDPKVLTTSGVSHSEFWKQQLKDSIHTKARLNFKQVPEEVYIQSAHSQITSQVYGERWLKVGDAAQSFDPLSSAGIIKGFKMGQAAANALFNFSNGDTNALIVYESDIKKQYKDYLIKREEYYKQESRWVNRPFWYERILLIKEIKKFTITPMCYFKITNEDVDQKITFLRDQVPNIDFLKLVSCIERFPVIKDAIGSYLNSQSQIEMNPLLLHALEAMKIIKLIV